MFLLITGSMGSGKSETLINRVKKSNKKKFIFSSSKGCRKPGKIISRNGKSIGAIPINLWKDVKAYLESYQSCFDESISTEIYIDEVQFLEANTEAFKDLLYYCYNNNVDLNLFGLDINCFGDPFPVIGMLLAYADEVIKLKGVCRNCGEVDSTRRVVRYIDGNLDRSRSTVLLTDNLENMEYYSLCPACFEKIYLRKE